MVSMPNRSVAGLTLLRCAALAAVALLPGAAAGQRARVQVTVASDAGTKIADVELVIRKDGSSLYAGSTNDQGTYTFIVEIDTGRYSLVARRLGYVAQTRDLRLAPDSTLALTIVLAHASTNLDTVRIIAEQLRSKNYRLGGAEITASTRGIFDALDAIRKLRPAMMGDDARMCPSVNNVWVNGKRVWWVAPKSPNVRGRSTPVAGTNVTGGTRDATGFPPASRRSGGGGSGGPPGLIDVLMSIHSEHVEDIRYVNCWDTSGAQMGTGDALFFTLKPGIGWDWKHGSYVANDLVARPIAPAPRTRYPRLLGVFDSDTGDPIDSVEVRDSLSGLSRVTSRTGTLTLGFVPVDGGVLLIGKAGYRTTTIRLAPSDTTPITAVLAPNSPKPPSQ